MVIRCFGDDLTGFVHDGFHGPPPIQRAGQRRRDGARSIYLSNLVPGPTFPQPTNITASVFDLRHIAHHLCVPTGIKLSRDLATDEGGIPLTSPIASVRRSVSRFFGAKTQMIGAK